MSDEEKSPRVSRHSSGSQTTPGATSDGSRHSTRASQNSRSPSLGKTDSIEQKKDVPLSDDEPKSPSNVTSAGMRPSLTRRDPLNTEYIYYSSMLKCLAPALTAETNRCRVIPWIRKLFGPEYQVEKFRAKRNKYLCSLTVTLMNDEVTGVFHNPPPPGALYDIEDLACEKYDEAEWETDPSWEEMLSNMPENYMNTCCTIHGLGDCRLEEDWSQQMLDEEFKLFLYLVRPYAALILEPDDKAKVASWLQILCCVPPGSCVAMKSLRNDYMRSLYGCVHDLCVAFPFSEFAPSPPLPVPHLLAKGAPPKQRFTDPTSQDANEFLKSQPVPENGAFCYLAVSGEVLESSLPLEPDKIKRKRRSDASTRHVEIRTSRMETTAEVEPFKDDERPCRYKG